MYLTELQCDWRTALPNKITAIIPTSQSPRQILLWSFLSLILRTKPIEKLEHFIVCINGPDSRTGDPTLQDEKQKMFEELRHTPFMHWKNGMPITIQRTWSRLGHGESLDAAIPWVHTDEYLAVHDDMILLDNEWLQKMDQHYADSSICATQVAPVLNGGISFIQMDRNSGYRMEFPHINTTFILCKRGAMKQLGTWRGYHVNHSTWITKNDLKHLLSQYNGELRRLPTDEELIHVEVFSYDIGAWLYHQIKKSKYRLNPNPLPNNTLLHFQAVSWSHPEQTKKKLKEHSNVIESLEEEIMNSPFGDFYEKWK